MELSLSEVKPSIARGIKSLQEILNISEDPSGLNVEIIKGNSFSITCDKLSLRICYAEKVQIFRGLGLAAEKSKEGESFHLEEEMHFQTCGPLLDMSQNGVLTVSSIKQMLRMIALMGLNKLYLYLEDVYEVESLPYFGYMRGRYSKTELKEIDDYAGVFGIEVIPAIQTLGHMERALRWNYANRIKDTKEILLAESQETYDFISKLIQAVGSCFKTKKIHLGMDESTSLGTGEYLRKNGYKSSSEILISHLRSVLEIVRSLDLEPMIWSDMFFRLASETGEYYDIDAEISVELANRIPEGLTLVYWDYYHHDEEIYDAMIRKHKRLGSKVMFAGGVWTWNSSAANYRKTFDTLHAGLKSCRRNGLKDAMITIWGDDGNEANIFSALPGLQLASEYVYGTFDSDRLKDRFKTCTGGDFDTFWLMSLFDDTPGTDYVSGDQPVYNPSKFCLWQDLLMGLFDRNISQIPLRQHYEKLFRMYKEHKDSDEWRSLHNYYMQLAAVLSCKTDLGIAIKSAYDRNDRSELSRIADHRLKALKVRVGLLHEAHRHLWFSFYKAFGWEVLDIRYGGLIQRILSAKKRLNDYLEGAIDRIEELEIEKLPYDGGFHFNDQWLMTENKYANCVTANQFMHNPNG